MWRGTAGRIDGNDKGSEGKGVVMIGYPLGEAWVFIVHEKAGRKTVIGDTSVASIGFMICFWPSFCACGLNFGDSTSTVIRGMAINKIMVQSKVHAHGHDETKNDEGA